MAGRTARKRPSFNRFKPNERDMAHALEGQLSSVLLTQVEDLKDPESERAKRAVLPHAS